MPLARTFSVSLSDFLATYPSSVMRPPSTMIFTSGFGCPKILCRPPTGEGCQGSPANAVVKGRRRKHVNIVDHADHAVHLFCDPRRLVFGAERNYLTAERDGPAVDLNGNVVKDVCIAQITDLFRNLFLDRTVGKILGVRPANRDTNNCELQK